MSERYTRLFSLPNQLYTTGSPILFAAGALLKDNVSGKVLVQLKLQNIGDKPIKAVTVKIFPMNTVEKPLGEPVIHQYLDLNNIRESQFCQKSPIYLSDASTRSFRVIATEVCFSDNTIWSNEDTDWKPLPLPQKLPIKDEELLKQYHIEYGQDCEYSVDKFSDLWYCACGALNRQSEPKCFRCGKSFSVMSNIDMNVLTENRDKRLEQEKLAKEQAQEKAAKTKKKAIKIIAIVAPIVAVCIIFIILLMTVIIPNIKSENEKAQKYESAIELAEKNKYSEAIDLYTELGDYKDSAERIDSIKESAYLKAKKDLDSGRYLNAAKSFEELGDYKDSSEIVSEYNKYNDVCTGSDINKLIDFYNGSKYFKNKIALEAAKKLAPYCGSWSLSSGKARSGYSYFTIGYSLEPSIDNSDLEPTITLSFDTFVLGDENQFPLFGMVDSPEELNYFEIKTNGVLTLETFVNNSIYDGEFTKK